MLNKTLSTTTLGKFSLTSEGTHAYLLDGENLTYYSNLDCEGSTLFCQTHCYAKKYPQGLLDTVYNLHDFHPSNISDVFTNSKLVVFFGRGTLSGFDASPEEVINTIGKWHKDKSFKFYLRSVPHEFDCPENCLVHLAIDNTSNIDINEALLRKEVNVITVIDHPDNAAIIKQLVSIIPKMYCTGVQCSSCALHANYALYNKLLLVQKLQD